MFAHNRRLQYGVRVSQSNPDLANLMPGFLITREVAHQKPFEKALRAMEPNFPPGKLPGDARFTKAYFNMSHGEPEKRGPWNQGEQWRFVSDRDQQMAVDGGSGAVAGAAPAGSQGPDMAASFMVAAAA